MQSSGAMLTNVLGRVEGRNPSTTRLFPKVFVVVPKTFLIFSSCYFGTYRVELEFDKLICLNFSRELINMTE